MCRLADLALLALLLVACDKGTDRDRDGYLSVADGGDDCDDTDYDVNPGVPEICDDGIDNNCNELDDGCVLRGHLSLKEGDAVITGGAVLDTVGWSAAGLGDIDDDDHTDIALGAPGQDEAGGSAGAVYVFAGPLSGDLGVADATATIYGEAPGDNVGHAVAGAGDVDADGYGDLLIGGWGVDRGTEEEVGAAWLLFGPISGTHAVSEAADATVHGEARFEVVGWAVAGVGDTDGDEVADVLVSSPYDDAGGEEAGAVYLFNGPFHGNQELGDATARLVGEGTLDYAGIAASGAGDVDGDGLADVVVGAYWEDTAALYAGAAYVVHGPVGGTTLLADAAARRGRGRSRRVGGRRRRRPERRRLRRRAGGGLRARHRHRGDAVRAGRCGLPRAGTHLR